MDAKHKSLALSAAVLLIMVTMFSVFQFCMAAVSVMELIKGNKLECEVEGSRLQNLYCFECFCQNKSARCWRSKCFDHCLSFEDYKQKQSCCEECKGCYVDNNYYESDKEWIDENDVCKKIRCQNGLIYVTMFECAACDGNSTTTTMLSECCSLCANPPKNISLPGRNLLNDSSLAIDSSIINNNNLNTSLEFNNSQSVGFCENINCVNLECDPTFQEKKTGECCSQCNQIYYSIRENLIIKTPDLEKYEDVKKINVEKKKLESCTVNNTIYQHGQSWMQDRCQNCTCDRGRIDCPPYCPGPNCSELVMEIIIPEGECCYKCVEPEEYFAKKRLESQFYQAPALNQSDKHEIEKKEEEKKEEEIKNDKDLGYKNEVEDEDEKDIETYGEEDDDDGTCKINRGSHFRTFDGNVFAIRGSCEYTLVSDCYRESFDVQLKTVILKNEVMMKKILIIYEKREIEIWKKQVKVNDKIVSLPYRGVGGNWKIVKKSGDIVVTLKNEVQVSWNYVMGLLEVTVPKTLRKKVCGLCGNFDSEPGNDLTTRENILVEDPSVFAQSWSVGDDICFNTRRYQSESCDTDLARRICSYVKGSFFERCDAKLRVTPYYEQCLEEMCECTSSDEKCYCKSFERYVYDCKLIGVYLPRWKKSVGC